MATGHETSTNNGTKPRIAELKAKLSVSKNGRELVHEGILDHLLREISLGLNSVARS